MRKIRRTVTVLAAATLASLAIAAVASAHAAVSPPVALANVGQLFSLAVPTEKEGLTTTRIELTPPKDLSIDSFAPAPGWKREVQQTGSGEEATVTRVTWTGGRVPTQEDAFFQFLGFAKSSGKYTFGVRQTYSDGSVVDWSGPESSDTPAPVVELKSSLGGGGGSSTLAIVALVVGAVGVVLGAIALFVGGGRGGRALA